MSRSYREPWYVDGYGTKRKRYIKNQANRRIRHAKNIPDQKTYKKYYSQYDICDYKYKYDGIPYVSHWGGEMHIVEPDPIWRVARK